MLDRIHRDPTNKWLSNGLKINYGEIQLTVVDAFTERDVLALFGLVRFI